ncbi:MAG TPA: mobile mystery protein B [Ilumatobacter sp.]|nr:mobile mystery protein B [Ilumatobacter sp.]
MDLTGGPPGSTPLSIDDLEGLRLSWVQTQTDLNGAEQTNIEQAFTWAFGRRRGVDRLLDVSFVNQVHRRMFGDVWKWAGKFRLVVTNIGVEPMHIQTSLYQALENARWWHEQATYGPVEIAVRLHHAIVTVHPYRNGNGRHSRLVADMYLHEQGLSRLTWGIHDVVSAGDTRARYIAALQAADSGDYLPLFEFATSA